MPVSPDVRRLRLFCFSALGSGTSNRISLEFSDSAMAVGGVAGPRRPILERF